MMVNDIARRLGMRPNVKIVIAGDGAVGKTTISQRLTGSLRQDKDRLMTCGIDFHSLEIVNGSSNRAQIWDLGGQEQFRTFQKPFFTNADIVILVFSVEWFFSFLNLDNWIDMMRDVSPSKIFLLANKVDNEDRVISQEEASEFAKLHNMIYYEISGLTGKGFEDFKNELINTLKQIYCS